MRRLFLVLFLMCGAASAQTYYTDCSGLVGTSLAGTLVCPNLPAGVTTAFNPQAVVNHVYPSEAGATVWNVTSGVVTGTGGLETQINAAMANCGTAGVNQVVVVPVANYVASSTFIPNANTCGPNTTVIIRSANLSSLPPPGTRINVGENGSGTDANNMPTWSTSNGLAILILADRPSIATHACNISSGCTQEGVWIAGINFNLNVLGAGGVYGIVQAGDACSSDTDAACVNYSGNFDYSSSCNQSCAYNRITLDRVWVHTTPVDLTNGIGGGNGAHHGVRFSASNFAIEDSVVGPIKQSGTQTTAVSSDRSWGPVDIGNNELSSFGEPLLFDASLPLVVSGCAASNGGMSPTCELTADMYVRQNHIYKPLSWVSTNCGGGAGCDQRSFVEFKGGQRILIEGNVFENDTIYKALLLFPAHTGSAVYDVTYRYNVVNNVNDWVNITGMGVEGTTNSYSTKRVNIHDNIVNGLSTTWPNLNVTLTGVTISGSNAIYSYSGFTAVDPSIAPWVGGAIAVSGFTNSGNNISYANGTITAIDLAGKTITVTATTQVNETHAATAIFPEGNAWPLFIEPSNPVENPGGCSSTGTICQVSDIIYAHNTVTGVGGTASGFTGTPMGLAAFMAMGGNGLPSSGDKVINLAVVDNISPSGRNSFSFDSSVSHPLTTAFGNYNTNYIFDGNVITDIVAGGGYGVSDFPSPICNFSNSTGNGCPSTNPGFAAALSNAGFVNFTGDSTGDYHLCFANGVPSGCAAGSNYMSLALDGLQDRTRFSLSPGANVDAVNNMTACAVSGKCAIAPLKVTGPYVGDYHENFYTIELPGYETMRLGDGGGVNGSTGAANSEIPLFMSGLGYRFWDTYHDPAKLFEIGGWDAGAMSLEYYVDAGSTWSSGTTYALNDVVNYNNVVYQSLQNSNLNHQPDISPSFWTTITAGAPSCGIYGVGSPDFNIGDNKGFFGSIFILYSNNVRIGAHFKSPMNKGPDGSLTNAAQVVPNVFEHEYFNIYRPGRIAEKFSWENSCGATIQRLVMEWMMTNQTVSFSGFSGVGVCSGGTAAHQYPPQLEGGWDEESVWAHNPAASCSNVYTTGTNLPWRFIDTTRIVTGLLFHSTVAGDGCPGTQSSCGNGDTNSLYTPGSTKHYTNGTIFPISAEFLQLMHEDSGIMPDSYQALDVIGERTNMLLPVSSGTIPSNGADSSVRHRLAWYGALGIGTKANAQLRLAEYNSPPTPTMNAGTSPSFNYDRAAWMMTADVTHKVDFTLTGTMYDPVFEISGWNSATPVVTINGVQAAATFQYTYSLNDGTADPCSGISGCLLLQIVNPANAANTGDVALPSSTHIVISAGAAPPTQLPSTVSSGVIPSGDKKR